MERCIFSFLDSFRFQFKLINSFVNNNVSKDRSFLAIALVSDILTNPNRVTLSKKVTFWEKSTANFAF